MGGNVDAKADPGAAARAVVELANAGQFPRLEKLMSRQLRSALPPGALGAAWRAEFAEHGGVTAIGDPEVLPTQAGQVPVRVPVSCAEAELAVFLSFDGRGRITGIRIAPAQTETQEWTVPRYVREDSFTEKDVVLPSGVFPVEGTLSLPVGPGPHPAVVLLAGGGPFDRDEAFKANKPLKDLAWGLASAGVAVLRFDKVTHTHSELSAADGFVAEYEYAAHARDAVRVLAATGNVDPGRVFLLGHSMGGKIAPRIAAGCPTVRGLILLAADASPMHEAVARVARHVGSLSTGPHVAAAVAALISQAERAGSLDLTASTPASALPFGYPASYWLDMRSYDPVAAAAALGLPMLVLQGARDYQVTVADDLALWRNGLAGREDVVFHVYEADDHEFFPGDGPSTPAGYDAPQHVDSVVVADIARWIHGDRGGPEPDRR